MRALITNDDGIDSLGLHALAEVAVTAGLDVVVAAPHTERSGASASLGAMRSDGRVLVEERLLYDLHQVKAYAVEGTPAYITWAALRGAFGEAPALVLSGVNKGPNTGNAVLHSGTVGATLTGIAHGVPGLAVSLAAAAPERWDTAKQVAGQVLEWLLGRAQLDPVVLNVNVPDVPMGRLRGIRSAPLASFGAVQADIAEVGEGFVTMTFSEIDVLAEPESDAALQLSGWATVTALIGPAEVDGYPLDGLVDPG